MQIETINETRQELLAWGAMARSGLDHVGYPKESPLRKYMITGYSEVYASPVDITDERFLKIDGAIAKLGSRHEEERAALCMRYIHLMTERQIAKNLQCSKSKTSMILAAAEAWIDARLFE
ncbi:hypothetical protein F9L16_23450 [Agarivorans sp. B2Z047]|uniref:antiterminator Q family protein n=1 Tax=Agarivorans sp. B2Z047 TaxID=2652721 RepID=UPI00128D5A63|nr:antiterminator Q family protein [Agarivorans sp. B2Z047]MPW31913.1 hypothetical protein [Agarivorans sp. B2Z047]UQN44863.1 hypothetical protein LQZ07_10480 [Agarivorans sp. B2Z047]